MNPISILLEQDFPSFIRMSLFVVSTLHRGGVVLKGGKNEREGIRDAETKMRASSVQSSENFFCFVLFLFSSFSVVLYVRVSFLSKPSFFLWLKRKEEEKKKINVCHHLYERLGSKLFRLNPNIIETQCLSFSLFSSLFHRSAQRFLFSR